MRRSASARQAVLWALLAASLGGAALYTGLRLMTPSDGGRIEFYGDAWTAAGVRIAPIDAPADGLAAGDLVVEVDGRSMDHWLGQVLDPGVARPEDGAPYAVVRDGVPLVAVVAWAPPATGATLLDGWSVVLFSITLAAVAAFVLRRSPDRPATTALVIATCGAAGSSVPWFLGATTSDVVQGGPFLLETALTAGLYMVLWPAAVHLALVFPAPPPAVRRRRWLVPSVYAAALGAYALGLAAARVASPTALEWVGTWPRVQLAIVIPCLALWLILAARTYVRPAGPEARARSRWAAIGAGASVILALALFQVPELVMGSSIVPASWIGLIALPLPLGLAVGIVRDRLFDIDVALNRTLVYGTLTGGILVVYVAATLVGSVAGPEHGYGITLLATGLAALVALPMRDVLQRRVNRLMYGQRDEPWRAMARLGARLEWAADPDLAFPAIAETVADSLRLPYVAVEIVDEVGRVQVVARHGATAGPTEQMPLVHGAEPVGRLVLGVRSGERGFRADEVALLRDLARQAGAAIHALRLREALARSRERLVVAREEERRRLRRDLHDGLGPSLAAIGMRAEAAAAVLDNDPEAGRRQLDALGDEIRVALADVRRLVDGLRPPALDELGLAGAIGQQAARLDGGSDREPGTTAIRVECVPAVLPGLPAAVEVAAYRIAVEAMTNAVRHAGARLCRVRIEATSYLTIEVTDDGTGLPAAMSSGTGLESMRERAEELGGDVAIEPHPGGGTGVIARLPLQRAAPG